MYVLNNHTGEKLRASISLISPDEIAKINKTKRFNFNWNKEKEFKVYKLTVIGLDDPIGLVSLNVRRQDYALEIRLLAASRENIGRMQKYSRIAGCLIAFVCKEAFKAGFEGFVCLKPKTLLEKYYIEKYGFQSTKLFLVSEAKNSLKLIREYDEE